MRIRKNNEVIFALLKIGLLLSRASPVRGPSSGFDLDQINVNAVSIRGFGVTVVSV
jgi:hypothetical protein